MTAGGITLAFDIYGTLANTGGVAGLLAAHTEDAPGFAARWRDKQLEYTFRRTAMGCYADFAQCTREALAFVCRERGVALGEEQQQILMAEYSRLPLFADAKDALPRLRAGGNVRMFAFSNGTSAAVAEWLGFRGIGEYFAGIVSADEVQKFKPSPEVYQHFLHRAEAKAENTYLISGNPFDIIGAQNVGINGIWLKRTAAAVFDPWQGITPKKTITTLAEVADMFAPAADSQLTAVHVLDNEGLCKKQKNGLWESGYWLISEKNAGRLCANGGMIYIHRRDEKKRLQPSLTGGRVVDFRREPRAIKNGKTITSTVLIFEQLPECENMPPPEGGFGGAGVAYRYEATKVKSAPAQPVKIHVFIDLENNLAKEDVACLLAWLREGGLPITGKAVTAKPDPNPFKTWDATLNEYGIEKIKTGNTGKDAADAALVGEIAVETHKQKTGDIICIVSGDHIFDKAAESALGRGFRVMRFGKAKPSWTTDNPNYRFFDINDTIAGKSQFPEEWKTRPPAKK